MNTQFSSAIPDLPQVRRRQEWLDLMPSLEAYPPAPFDLCLNLLPSQYAWVKGDAHTFSEMGLIGIYSRGGLRFICLSEFAQALDQVLGHDPDPLPLPVEHKLDRVQHDYAVARAKERFPEYRYQCAPLGTLTTETIGFQQV